MTFNGVWSSPTEATCFAGRSLNVEMTSSSLTASFEKTSLVGRVERSMNAFPAGVNSVAPGVALP